MISEKIEAKMLQTNVPKFSIIKVSGNMQMNVVSGRTILIFKEPLELILTGLTEQIGKPKEYQKKEGQPQNQEVDLTIPLSVTNEWKSLNQKSEDEKDEKIS